MTKWQKHHKEGDAKWLLLRKFKRRYGWGDVICFCYPFYYINVLLVKNSECTIKGKKGEEIIVKMYDDEGIIKGNFRKPDFSRIERWNKNFLLFPKGSIPKNFKPEIKYYG